MRSLCSRVLIDGGVTLRIVSLFAVWLASAVLVTDVLNCVQKGCIILVRPSRQIGGSQIAPTLLLCDAR